MGPQRARPGTEPLLTLQGVTRVYGGMRAVDHVDLRVDPGERRALIGPNGAGKTTLLDLIGGGRRVTAGRIRFGGHDVTAEPEHRRARLGIARTFQHTTLFEGLSATQNVALAVRGSRGSSWRPWPSAGEAAGVDAEAAALLAEAGLGHRAGTAVGDLSHGEKRQVEVAVALATRPRLLLLDEPSSGMAPAETAAFVALVRRLPADLTVVLVEHDMDVVFALATRVTVLDAGRLLAEGAPAEVRADPAVRTAYLGQSA